MKKNSLSILEKSLTQKDLMNKNIKDAMKKHIEHFEKNKDLIAAQREEEAKNNKNCFSYWFPKINSIEGVLTPKTIIVPFHYNDLLKALDSNFTESYFKSLEAVKEACRNLGFPCFIKNSHFSGKHSWNQNCFVQKEEDLENNLLNLTSDAYCLGVSDSLYIIVRELIPTRPAFFAFGGTPITKEFRFFVIDGKVTHVQPYWPLNSINDPNADDFDDRLKQISTLSQEQEKYLMDLSQKVSQNIEGAWSVDWLQSKSGDWYLIDMALEESSFKWSPK